MRKEVKLWRNPMLIAVGVGLAKLEILLAAGAPMLRPEEAVDLPAGPPKRADLLVAVEPTPRQNASNRQVLTASPVNTPADK